MSADSNPDIPVHRDSPVKDTLVKVYCAYDSEPEWNCTMAFYTVLGFMAVNGFEYSEPGSFDVISRLPLEMAIDIMRLLSGKDLLNAACVNKRWHRICKSDSKLRKKIRSYIRRNRRNVISSRIVESGGRNVFGVCSNRPTMRNIVNISNSRRESVDRLPRVVFNQRYMPYRLPVRQQTIATNISSRRVQDIETTRYSLRM